MSLLLGKTPHRRILPVEGKMRVHTSLAPVESTDLWRCKWVPRHARSLIASRLGPVRRKRIACCDLLPRRYHLVSMLSSLTLSDAVLLRTVLALRSTTGRMMSCQPQRNRASQFKRGSSQEHVPQSFCSAPSLPPRGSQANGQRNVQVRS